LGFFPTWRHVTQAIKTEEEKKTEKTYKEKKCKRRKQNGPEKEEKNWKENI
jgi:hypothetical protein